MPSMRNHMDLRNHLHAADDPNFVKVSPASHLSASPANGIRTRTAPQLLLTPQPPSSPYLRGLSSSSPLRMRVGLSPLSPYT
ncbi:hypothetical protein BD310DRAFT_913221 [Dichomitus squalens]|uniref:Uncharacterized protein n=1 Tax=Dichomitus squalens TaxID=114155 RepID=A0A4Q9QAQ3_9APHY|nr:hypothetical protein BD310DRAFT_913221 [Dichomitus squalens]